MKRIFAAVAGLLIVVALSGCASSTVSEATRHSDEGITSIKLIANSDIRAGDIDVSSSQAVVTLIGRVKSETIKSDAERIARGTKGVKDVNNELTVGGIER